MNMALKVFGDRWWQDAQVQTREAPRESKGSNGMVRDLAREHMTD